MLIHVKVPRWLRPALHKKLVETGSYDAAADRERMLGFADEFKPVISRLDPEGVKYAHLNDAAGSLGHEWREASVEGGRGDAGSLEAFAACRRVLQQTLEYGFLKYSVGDETEYAQMILQNLTNEEPGEIRKAAAIRVGVLESMHRSCRKRARDMFHAGLMFCLVGILFFVGAVISMTAGAWNVGIIGIVFAIVIELLSVLMLELYWKDVKKAHELYGRIDRVQELVLANSMCDTLDDAGRSRVREKLVSELEIE